MNELIKKLIANAKGNPITTALGFLALSCAGAGTTLSSAGIEPWGSAVTGVAAFLALGLGFVAKDSLLPPGPGAP